MLRHCFLALPVALGFLGFAFAQSPSAWKAANETGTRNASPPTPIDEDAAPADAPNRSLAPVSVAERNREYSYARSDENASVPLVASRPVNDNLNLPNDAGQAWQSYDITPYTARITTTKRPELAVIDWILQDTGYEMWHTDPLGILTANGRTLRVYHTPDMHKRIADVVERFNSAQSAGYTFTMRIITLDDPTWRTSAQRLMRSVPVQTTGLNAWLMPKENAAILLGEIRRRSDFREHSSPHQVVNNAQSTVISSMHGRPYVRDVVPRPDTAAGFEPVTGQIDEGFAFDFSPLLSADRKMIDAIIKCQIDQVEKMIPTMIDVQTTTTRQRTKVEVPQLSHYRFHERFHWPIDEVLLVNMGMVAQPIPVDGSSVVPGLSLPIGTTPARADLLVLIECKGQSSPAAAANPANSRAPLREAKNYRGRY